MPTLSLPAALSGLSWPRWLSRVAEVVLGLVILGLLGRIAWAFLPTPAMDVGAGAASAQPPSPLPVADLFYRRGGTAMASAGDAAGLSLHGVRSGADASAILSGDDGIQRAWPVGSEPLPGVELVQVGADHVVLTRGGSPLRLALAPRPALATRNAVNRSPAPATTPVASTMASPASPLASAPRPPAPVVQAASPGTETGYRLGEEAGQLPLRLAGLRPGDEILSINGQSVAGQDAEALRARLAGQTRFELRYRRDGELRTTRVGLPR
ncbi:PDZ domain-containing protein [Lysobacter sp. GX 14042]|uniref:type II secretion system protein N n=1 Tax=Lysobacter sp. GX 14042 TaxID=2907155 RepID=UPI001F1BBDFC|nr:type II secretion system protein N [Lysobacter sp. GX 14042]MCE7033209.1 PDZ domain-containing protein [Lysobacter sp. GX 14042]